MKPENIKTKINFHLEGQSKPFASTEDYEILKQFFLANDSSEINIKTVEIENKTYDIVNTEINILKKTSNMHLKYGVDHALSGAPLLYNFRVSVYLKKKPITTLLKK